MGLCGFALSFVLFSIVHFCQFVLALVVCGLYGVDLHAASLAGKYTDSKWVYAEVVGGLSATTTLLYLVPFILRFSFVWIWNVVIFALWIALFGVFGSMYIHADPQGDAGIQRMKNAVWVDLTNALLWLFTSVAAFVYWWSHRERKTRFTGRATV